MYLDLFKLSELPFRLSPDPAFLYLSKNHARAKAYMESTIWLTDGFVIITGEIGSGKTTLIETFIHELEKDVIVAHINQTQLLPAEFLQAVLVQFGYDPFRMKKVELLATINHFLLEQHNNGRRVLLIVDEAQNLSRKVLEEIRMLSGVETTKEKIMRIILAGQPELNDKLDSPELAQLTQRVRLRFHLTPLSEDDATAYIQHRLEIAGSGGREIFAPDTFELIYRYTGGVPRLINILCDTALMSAAIVKQDRVTRKEVDAAISELRWTEHLSHSTRLPAMTTAPSHTGHTAYTASPHVTARFLLSHQGTSLGEYYLMPGRQLIGRTRENDICIDSRFVSRHHSQIITTANSCIIEDLNSTNGISHNGKRIRRRVLNDGDVIQIGEHELVYVDERHSRPTNTLEAPDDAVPMLSETMNLSEGIKLNQNEALSAEPDEENQEARK